MSLYAFISEKLLMVSLLFHFIFVKICLITVGGNETTCCVTLFCIVSHPTNSFVYIHPSIYQFRSLFYFLPVPLLYFGFNAFKIAYELAGVYFCYGKKGKAKKYSRQTYKQTKHPHKWLARWQKQPFSPQWANKGPQLQRRHSRCRRYKAKHNQMR